MFLGEISSTLKTLAVNTYICRYRCLKSSFGQCVNSAIVRLYQTHHILYIYYKVYEYVYEISESLITLVLSCFLLGTCVFMLSITSSQRRTKKRKHFHVKLQNYFIETYFSEHLVTKDLHLVHVMKMNGWIASNEMESLFVTKML